MAHKKRKKKALFLGPSIYWSRPEFHIAFDCQVLMLPKNRSLACEYDYGYKVYGNWESFNLEPLWVERLFCVKNKYTKLKRRLKYSYFKTVMQYLFEDFSIRELYIQVWKNFYQYHFKKASHKVIDLQS